MESDPMDISARAAGLVGARRAAQTSSHPIASVRMIGTSGEWSDFRFRIFVIARLVYNSV
ncbi:MAG: hypothetical protein ACLQVD_18405 [Capsulimonadaceae bacterium]